MNESLVKYLAGLLDADGSMSFSFKADANRAGRHFVGLSLNLAASDAVDPKGFVDSLPDLTGMGSVSRYGDRKQFKTWAVSRRADLEMLVPRLVKHQVIKARHWQWLLDEWRERRSDSKTVSDAEREEMAEASKASRRERVGPLKAKNHPTWAWLAGYLDGDGWYSYRSGVYRGYRQWSMSVGAVAHVTDMSVLEFLHASFGGSILNHNKSGTAKLWRRSLGYQNRSFALQFLPNLAKHSRLKRHKIDAIIHHHRQRLSVPGVEKSFCSEEGCDRPVRGHGLCGKHYLREWRKAQATV